MSGKSIAAVILAAGKSQRLGSPKQLVCIAGETLLRRTIKTVLASRVATTFVVLGHQSELLAQQLEGLPAWLTTAEDYDHGLSHSVRHALRLVQEDGRFGAALFVPCDLPLLSTEHLNALIDRYQETGAPIASSSFDGTNGIPALFDAGTWPDFEALQGDRGARAIIEKCPQCEAVRFDAAAFDLDTPADLERYYATHGPPVAEGPSP